MGCSGQLSRTISWPGSLTFPGRLGAVCPSRPPRHHLRLPLRLPLQHPLQLPLQLSSAWLFSWPVPSESFPAGTPPSAIHLQLGVHTERPILFLHRSSSTFYPDGLWRAGDALGGSVSHLRNAKRGQSTLLGCWAGLTPHLTRGQRAKPAGSSSSDTFTESACRSQGGGKIEAEKNRH